MSVTLVLLYQSLPCMDEPDHGQVSKQVGGLMPRYDRSVPNHKHVDLQLVSNVLSCEEMNCHAPKCTCTQVKVPESMLACRRVPAKVAWAMYPHRAPTMGAFASSLDSDHFVELQGFEGVLVPPRFAPTLLKLQMHKLIKHDSAIVSDVDVLFLSELGNLQQLLEKQPGLIGAAADITNIYNGFRTEVPRPVRPLIGGIFMMDLKGLRASNFDVFLRRQLSLHSADGPLLLPEQDIINEFAVKNPGTVYDLPCSWAWLVPDGQGCHQSPDIMHGYLKQTKMVDEMYEECSNQGSNLKECLVQAGRQLKTQGRQEYYTTPTGGFVACVTNCGQSTTGSSVSAAMPGFAGTTTVTCTTTCTARQDSRTATVVVTGATTAQLQSLQTAITNGQVAGVPRTTIVVGSNGQPVSSNTTCSGTNKWCLSTVDCAKLLGSSGSWPAGTCCARASGNGTAASPSTCIARQTNGSSTFQTSAPTETICKNAATAGLNLSQCSSGSKKGLLGLLGLLGLIPLLLCLLLLCLCCLRRRKRQQAVKFGEVPGPEIPMAPPAPIIGQPQTIGVPVPCAQPVPVCGAAAPVGICGGGAPVACNGPFGP